MTTATVSAPNSPGEIGDDRGRADAGTAAQARGDEHHVGALQHLDDHVRVFQGRLASDLGIRSGAQASGHLRAQLQLIGDLAGCQRL